MTLGTQRILDRPGRVADLVGTRRPADRDLQSLGERRTLRLADARDVDLANPGPSAAVDANDQLLPVIRQAPRDDLRLAVADCGQQP